MSRRKQTQPKHIGKDEEINPDIISNGKFSIQGIFYYLSNIGDFYTKLMHELLIIELKFCVFWILRMSKNVSWVSGHLEILIWDQKIFALEFIYFIFCTCRNSSEVFFILGYLLSMGPLLSWDGFVYSSEWTCFTWVELGTNDTRSLIVYRHFCISHPCLFALRTYLEF